MRGRGVDGRDVSEDDGGRDGGDVVLIVAARARAARTSRRRLPQEPCESQILAAFAGTIPLVLAYSRPFRFLNDPNAYHRYFGLSTCLDGGRRTRHHHLLTRVPPISAG